VLRIHQGLAVEVTVVQQLNQGERKKCAVYHFFLDFLVLFIKKKVQKELLLKRQKKVRTMKCDLNA